MGRPPIPGLGRPPTVVESIMGDGEAANVVNT